MTKIGAFLLQLVRNKWFWIVLAVLVLLLIIRSNWARIKGLFMRDGGDYSTPPLTPEQEEFIKGLVQELHVQIHKWPPAFGAREDAMRAMVNLNDKELRFAAQQYKYVSRDESMYEAVKGETMISEVKRILLGRLSTIKQL